MMLNIRLMEVQRRRKKSQQVNVTMVYIPTKYSQVFIKLCAPSDRGTGARDERFVGALWRFARGSGVLER